MTIRNYYYYCFSFSINHKYNNTLNRSWIQLPQVRTLCKFPPSSITNYRIMEHTPKILKIELSQQLTHMQAKMM